MDQDSPNGPGRSSWRDRLGIPREGAEAAEPRLVSPRAAALRPSAPPAAETPRPAPPQPPSRPAEPARTGASPTGLAERLRAQREAAEKLAEQRLAQARERAAQRANEIREQVARSGPSVFAPRTTTPRMAPEPAQAADPVAASGKPDGQVPPLRTAAGGAGPVEPKLELRPAVGLSPVAPRRPPRPPLPPVTVRRPAPPVISEPEPQPSEPVVSHRAQLPVQPVRANLPPPRLAYGSPAITAEPEAAPMAAPPALSLRQRLKGGPSVLLAVVLVMVMVLALMLFLWRTVFDSSGSGLAPQAASVPLVTAPIEPVKTPPAAAGSEATPEAGAAAGKKQIYDRILAQEPPNGQEQLAPGEEAPVTPGLPSPDADAALPVPEAPGADQGQGANDSDTQTAPETGGPAVITPGLPEPQAGVATPEAEGVELTVPAVDPGLTTLDTTPPAAEPPAAETPAAPVLSPVITVKPKPRPVQTTAATAPATTTTTTTTAPGGPVSIQPIGGNTPNTPALTTGQAGYVIQLASHNTEPEAMGDFKRLRGAHADIIGSLGPVITKADLGTKGTFYRLGIGPLASKEAASKLCAELIASGERDCIVRRQ